MCPLLFFYLFLVFYASFLLLQFFFFLFYAFSCLPVSFHFWLFLSVSRITFFILCIYISIFLVIKCLINLEGNLRWQHAMWILCMLLWFYACYYVFMQCHNTFFYFFINNWNGSFSQLFIKRGKQKCSLFFLFYFFILIYAFFFLPFLLPFLLFRLFSCLPYI